MKHFTLFLLIMFSGQLIAQNPADTIRIWKKGGDLSLSFSEVSFSNWAAGGKNSVSGVGLLNCFANYAQRPHELG